MYKTSRSPTADILQGISYLFSCNAKEVSKLFCRPL
jgi:hypothetical protein